MSCITNRHRKRFPFLFPSSWSICSSSSVVVNTERLVSIISLRENFFFHKTGAIPFKLVRSFFILLVELSETIPGLLTSYFPFCAISFLFHYLPESCFSDPTLMFACFISECFPCTLWEPWAAQHCPVPKLTPASLPTSRFSSCAWDLPGSPVALLVTSSLLFRDKLKLYLHGWRCPSAALDSAVNMSQ